MRAYSLDLRERIVRAVDQGYKRADIVKLFGVPLATVKRYLKRRRETGQVARKPIPGRPPQKSAPLRASGGICGRHSGNALPVVGADSWSTSQPQHHEPCDQASWLGLQEKDARCD